MAGVNYFFRSANLIVGAPGDRQGLNGEIHCDEGVAIRIGPEPCAVLREGIGEASVGVRAGKPLSRVSR
jgi:hypothetical protein